MINSTILSTKSSLNRLIDLKKVQRVKYLKDYKLKRKKHIKELKITLSVKEYEVFKKEATKYGITPNKLIINQALAYKNSNYLVPKSIDEDLKQLIFLFRNIANNINQIAKHSNIFKKLIGTNKIITNLATLEKSVIGFIKKPLLSSTKEDDSKKP